MGNEVLDIIRNTIWSFIPDSHIWLFGSRAKGKQDRFSDYDLLIVTPQTFTPKEKITWSSRIDLAIVKAINAPVDLLIFSEEEVKEKRELPGHIVRSALKEGIALL